MHGRQLDDLEKQTGACDAKHSDDYEVRTYAVDPPTEWLQQTLQEPAPAHIVTETAHSHRCTEICRRPALLTVGREASFVRSSSQVAGITLHEVTTPPAVLETALQQPPGTYQVVCTSHFVEFDNASLASTCSIGSEDEKAVVRFALKRADTLPDELATEEELDALHSSHPMPPIQGRQWWLHLRYRTLTFYRRLMILVLMANIATLVALIARSQFHHPQPHAHPHPLSYGDAATACGANLLAAVLMRHEHMINLLFHLALSQPACIPVAIRRNVAKIPYNNGGVHSGTAISALLWYILYAVLLVRQFHGTHGETIAVSATTALTLILLLLIITTSHPAIRRRYHDAWEMSHRYCGWTAVGTIWAQTLTIGFATAHRTHRPISRILLATPTFWFLILITLSLIYPWLRLRRLRVAQATQLSPHALELRFARHAAIPSCVGARLSHNPLRENHGFATIPLPSHDATQQRQQGYTILISKAGDWTTHIIQNPPTHIWRRGAPVLGVMRLASLFRPLIVVATGSGIGPALSFLNAHPSHPQRILWCARAPTVTYGRDIVRQVLRADPRAVIVDSAVVKGARGAKLCGWVYAMVVQSRAEAVMVISNPMGTREVVFAMEARGVAAFGAVFDS